MVECFLDIARGVSVSARYGRDGREVFYPEQLLFQAGQPVVVLALCLRGP